MRTKKENKEIPSFKEVVEKIEEKKKRRVEEETTNDGWIDLVSEIKEIKAVIWLMWKIVKPLTETYEKLEEQTTTLTKNTLTIAEQVNELAWTTLELTKKDEEWKDLIQEAIVHIIEDLWYDIEDLSEE